MRKPTCKGLFLRLQAVAICLIAVLPAGSFAKVIVEPSIALTQESIDIEPEGLAYFEYQLAKGSELVFRLDLLRWRRVPLRIWLVDSINYERFMAGQPFDYIEQATGMMERAGQITFVAPETSRYFVVLDNSQSTTAKELSIYAYAKTPQSDPTEDRLQQLYQRYFDELNALFDMRGIEVQIRRCGRANAYAVEQRIVICRELHDTLTANAMWGVQLFVLLHEASHSLVTRWGHRSINVNPVMVDRLAATLFRMIDDDLANETATWLSESGEVVGGVYSVNNYMIPQARAQRIAGWLDGELRFDRRWSRRIVVPQMRTSALESLLDEGSLSDRTQARIQRELFKRATLSDSARR